MTVKLYPIIAFAMCAMLSCNKVEKGSYGSEFEAVSPKMEFPGTTAVSISSDGGTMELAFISTRDWKAAWEEDWVSLSPASGNGSESVQTLHLSVGKNSRFVRNATINFSAGYPLASVLVINQDGMPLPDPAIHLSAESIRVNASSTEARITIDATRDWVITPEGKQFSVSPISGSFGATDVTINFPANKEEKELTSSFLVSLVDENISKTFTLIQEAAEPDPDRQYYALVKSKPDSFDGKYLAVYTDGEHFYAMNPNDIGSVKSKYASPAEISVVNGVADASSALDRMAFRISGHKKLGEGWYSFIRNDGMFFYGGAEDKSEFLTKDTETANGSTITYIEDGNRFSMCYRGTNPLIYHKSNKAFVFIKKANAGNPDSGSIQLFRRYGPEN